MYRRSGEKATGEGKRHAICASVDGIFIPFLFRRRKGMERKDMMFKECETLLEN